MAQVSYDSRSFMVDGKRIWMVGATVVPSGVPRSSWADRLHAVRLLGANTVTVPVVWSLVESRPGQFDFTGQNDLRSFVQMAHAQGLMVLLRPGPYVGRPWDLGGLPAWLLDVEGLELRTSSRPFLEAASRYLSAVAREVRDLQVTATGRGGPIIAVQSEHQWTCGDEELATAYLGELNRYLREAGFTVPIVNTNNLWAGAEGEIDAWAGEASMLGLLRELALIRPDQPQPMLVTQFGTAMPSGLAAEPLKGSGASVVLQRLAEAFAGGGQVNIEPFLSPLALGFTAGADAEHGGVTSAAESDAASPVDAAGVPRELFHAVRRLCTFADSFGRVMAHLEPGYRPVVVDPSPDARGGRGGARAPSVVHLRGTQGSVAFVFAEAGRAEGRGEGLELPLMLPDGHSIRVPVGETGVGWVLFDTHLSGRSRLDYSTLCVMGLSGRCLAVFGPAGARGVVSINGTPLRVNVPTGDEPLVADHEDFAVVVVNERTADRTFLSRRQVVVGVQSVRADGSAVAVPGQPYWRVSSRELTEAETTVHRSKVERVAAERSGVARGGERGADRAGAGSAKPTIDGWECCASVEHASGQSPRFASIDGPVALSALGIASGYGWYRATVKVGAAKRVRVAIPESADRVQVFLDGASVGVLGRGPGAERELALSLKRGTHVVSMLADNMGRPTGGRSMRQPRGVFGEVYEVSALKPGKPKLVEGEPIELLAWQRPLDHVRRGDATWPMRVTWTFKHLKKTPVYVVMPAAPRRGVIVLNDKPLRFVESGEVVTLMLTESMTHRGNNTLQVAVVDDFVDEGEAASIVQEAAEAWSATVFRECVSSLTAKAQWAFAKWEPPAPSMFRAVTKAAATAGAAAAMPTWWRTQLHVADVRRPLRLELAGMTKGQLYLNGMNIGRYFVASAGAGAAPVPGPSSVLLPEAFLRHGANELTLFDEFGGTPAKVKPVQSAHDDVIRASAPEA